MFHFTSGSMATISASEPSRKWQHIKAGGIVPPSIEMTSILTAAILLDEKTQRESPEGHRDETAVKLSYTMALVRFVNSLLDPQQQGSYAMSLHRLAEITGLPSYFVELRHIGTHEYLPSLQMLRWAVGCALKWLDENYWQKVINLTPDDDHDDEELGLYVKDIRQAYHELRKLKFDKSHTKYWYYVDTLKAAFDQNPDILVNFLLLEPDALFSSRPTQKQVTQRIKQFEPVLTSLGIGFQLKLIEKLVSFANSQWYSDVKINLDNVIEANDLKYLNPRGKSDTDQAIKWLEYLVDTASTEEQVAKLIQRLSQINTATNITLLKRMDREILGDRIDQTLKTMEKFHVPTISTPKRRPKLSSKSKNSKKFPTYQGWRPLPFGIAP